MKLRWFQTYNKNGLDSQVALQYWNKEDGEWLDIPFVRISEDREDEYLHDEDAVH